MRRTSFEKMECSIARSLEVIGEWWTLLIVRDAFFGVTRFEEFQARLGIARNVLAKRLDTLVDHGVVERRKPSHLRRFLPAFTSCTASRKSSGDSKLR